ncbi:DnaJ domain-containing protein [Rhodomicrobium vannielii ATCC 17100]|uniref:DnaJ C-terminal domain-containing protein n=1 Tax=Rhodomicrobium vannielii TaxID=1069 RepID=UPI00191A0A85|nr:DnaJ C-terminal domain-containing protein [Rhodomicrobium vannielii]MBJ7533626.1 DnaJ domain-containing protein [Rhodomicrobium vannielii ATCC 17100]
MADPYTILGVSKTATDDEIRKAYKSLAKKNHPDLNPGDKEAEARFKDISAAYTFLGDKEKRRAYDAGEIDEQGQEKPQRRYYRDYADTGAGERYYTSPEGGFEGFGGSGDFSDLFGDILRRRGAGTGTGAGAGPGGAQFRMRGGDAHYALPVDFLEAVNGAKKRVDMPDGKTLEITIPAGVEEGQTLRLKGQGMPGIGGGPAGDALITVSVLPHPVFRREGQDIKSVLPVTLGEALAGGSVPVETVTGPVNVKIPKNSNTGRVLRLRGKGVQGKAKGDHLVELQVVLPPEPDAALEDFVTAWERDHPYNPRQGG